MNESRKNQARRHFEMCLENNHSRKTPERFAIFDAACSFNGYFSLVDLYNLLETRSFHVSRATLYNSIQLLQNFRLVISYRIKGKVVYEATFKSNHIHQICTVCGSSSTISSAGLMDAVENLKLRRFKQDYFSLNIYGICTACQSKLQRALNKEKLNI